MLKTKDCKDEYTTNEVVDDFHKFRIPGLDEKRAQVLLDVLKQSGKVLGCEKPGLSVLDIGCGAGEVTRLLTQAFDKVIGVDASFTQIAKALEIPSSVEFITGTGENLPVDDGTIDVITSVFSLNYFDVSKFAHECDRALKPGGIVLCYMDTLSKISSTDYESRPDASSMLAEMYKEYFEIFKAAQHPQLHVIDRFETLTNSLGCLNKSRVEMKIENSANLEAVWRHQLSIPMYGRLGITIENPMMELVENLKKMWSMEDLEDESINVKVTYDVSIIIMSKDE